MAKDAIKNFSKADWLGCCRRKCLWVCLWVIWSVVYTLAQYKKEYEWLKEVDSLALANAQMNLQTAYYNFFKRPEVEFPKFKSKKNHYCSYTTNNQGGKISTYQTDILNFLKLD